MKYTPGKPYPVAPRHLMQEITRLQYELGWHNGDLAQFLLCNPHLTLHAYATEAEVRGVIAALQQVIARREQS